MKTTKVLACSCAWLLLASSYALATSRPPRPAPAWYKLSFSIDSKSVPKGFVLREGKLEKTSDRDCVRADGTPLAGYRVERIAELATHTKYGRGRPARAKPPKPERVELEVFCDREHHVTQGRISYKDAGASQTWGRHVELDIEHIDHLIRARAWWGGTVSRELYLHDHARSGTLCTISAEQVGRAGTHGYVAVLGNLATHLTRLAGVSDHDSTYPESIDAARAPAPKSFAVFLDCYSTRTAIKARIAYGLDKAYRDAP